ncbi:MAG: RraA family protein [Rhodobacteraceae bacterium]|nr:RraA family protein [Paracoccaceae bacterium]
MTGSLLKLLQSVDTPTVCNAIEAAEGRRGFGAYTRGTMQCSDTSRAIVGYARTAQIAAAHPPAEPQQAIRKRRMDYYRHMAGGPRPAIAVVQDVDFPHTAGAYWGTINTTVHKGLGLNGALTNGMMRDLGDLPADFPVIAGSIGPSHGFVHLRSIGQPVEIFGMTVADGDLVHADRHGGLVVPPAVIDGLEAAILKLFETEKLVLDPARAEGFDIDTFEAAWAAFEESRT